MKAIISSTYDHLYIWNLPLVSWCWDKMGVDVICFLPTPKEDNKHILDLVKSTLDEIDVQVRFEYFDAPKDKQATYAQLSRLTACCLNDINDDDVLVTSDADMANFIIPPYLEISDFTVLGYDLTESSQYPVCYVSGKKSIWGKYFNTNNLTFQELLDSHLKDIECENMRGNYWCYEQEQLKKVISKTNVSLIPRAMKGTSFAANRVDREDSFWQDRLNKNIVDAHLWRPAWVEDNFQNILKLISFMHVNSDLTWLKNYNDKFKTLIHK